MTCDMPKYLGTGFHSHKRNHGFRGAQCECQKTSLVSTVRLRSVASFLRVGLCVHASPLPVSSSSSFLSRRVPETERKRGGTKSSQFLVLAYIHHTEATIQICNKLPKQARCVWSPISLCPLPPCPSSCGTLQTGQKNRLPWLQVMCPNNEVTTPMAGNNQ